MTAWPAPAKWPVTLRSGALVLRPIDRRDQARWEEIRDHSRVWLAPWDATPPPETSRPHLTFAEWIRDQHAMARDARALPWALAWDDGWPDHPIRHPALIGQVTVSSISWGSARSAQIGYWIDRSWAGRGLVPLGVALAADYCFHTLRLHRLEIDVLPENAPSHRVIEKLGFTPDGGRRSSLHIAGVWRDHEAYVMTADEAPSSLVDRVLAASSPVGYGLRGAQTSTTPA